MLCYVKSNSVMFFYIISVIYVFTNLNSLSQAFDFKHFLNITNEYVIKRYKKFHSCESRSYSDGNCCGCKPNCMVTKTCCIDAFWNSSYISRQEDYIKDFLARSRQYNDQECSRSLPRNFFHENIDSYYMRTSCDEKRSMVSKKLKYQCMMGNENGKSIDYYIPIKGNDKNLYRNKYCAVCNSVSEFEMVQVKKRCSENSCTIILNEDSQDSFPGCAYGPISNRTCPKNNKFYDLCRSFSGPMGKYANYFCHLCNHGYTSKNVMPNRCDLGKEPVGPFSWASLLKFDFSDKTDSQCKNGFDGVHQKCRSYACPHGYQARNSKCVAMNVRSDKRQNVKEASFDECLLAGNPKIRIRSPIDYQEVLKELFPTHKSNENNASMMKIGNQYFINGGSSIQNSSIIFAKLNIEKIKNMLHEGGSVTFSHANSDFLQSYKLSIKQIFPLNMICAKLNQVDIKTLKFTSNCDAKIHEKLIPFVNLSLHIVIGRKYGLTRKAYICNEFYLSKPCQRKVLDKKVTYLNKTRLVFKKDGASRIYKLHEYAPFKDGSYVVCINSIEYIHEPKWFSTVEKISGYVSIVGSSLSVVCYLLLIATVLQFSELRNVPGLCTLALSINLLIGDGLFLAANFMSLSSKHNENTILCDVIGILIHFFLSSAQMWSLIMAIDISVNLQKINLSSQNNKSKFIWYNIIPNFFAATLVSIALLFRAFDIIDVSYNRGGFCALQGFYSRIFLYFLPFLICFSVSAVSLTLSISSIGRERRKNENVLKGSTKNNTNMVQVGLKLVILCGLTEGVGIINIPLKHDTPNVIFIVKSIFTLLYSLMKAFRGFMIFIVYICRKPVYEMYKKRYGRKNVTHNDSASTSTTATTSM